MFILALLLAAFLCLLFETTRGFGLLLFIVLCLVNPALLILLMVIGLGFYLYSRLTHKPTVFFLPKE